MRGGRTKQQRDEVLNRLREFHIANPYRAMSLKQIAQGACVSDKYVHKVFERGMRNAKRKIAILLKEENAL